jgi:hypothetical protein
VLGRKSNQGTIADRERDCLVGGNFGATLWRRSLKFAYVAAPYCVLDALVDTWTAARVGERAGRGAIIRYAAALG